MVLRFSPSGAPVVRFATGVTATVRAETWNVRTGAKGPQASRRQIPLMLAWAISIHKSQGMTLDHVDIHLEGVFEAGQAYVALSRARSLRCMRVTGFSRRCVRADPVVVAYYKTLS